MRCLIVLAHPLELSLSHRFAACAVETLRAGGHDVTLTDLYAEGFDPRLASAERASYYAPSYDASAVADHAAALRETEVLVLVFPTWWFGPPAILKGWIDRVFAPGIAFDHGKDFGPIVPRLTDLRHAIAITTLGSPWWVDRFVMRRPVRRLLKTALIGGCAPGATFTYLPLHSAERPSAERIDGFERRIRAKLSSCSG